MITLIATAFGWGVLIVVAHYLWTRDTKKPAHRMTLELLHNRRVLEIGIGTAQPTIVTVPVSRITYVEHGEGNVVTVCVTNGYKCSGWMPHEDREKVVSEMWKE